MGALSLVVFNTANIIKKSAVTIMSSRRRRSQSMVQQKAGDEMPSKGSIFKETVLLSIFNVALSCFDVYSDLGLIYKFYQGAPTNEYCDSKYNCDKHDSDCFSERWKCYWEEVPGEDLTYTPQIAWGTMMLVPFLLNYFICWYAWFSTEKKKAFTWIAPLLNFYPQFSALKIICQMWKDPQKGFQKKKRLERELTQSETFCEAFPSFCVMSYLLAVVITFKGFSWSGFEEGSLLIFNPNDVSSFLLFWVAYITSGLTTSLGIAKNLKVGPCRILKEQTTCFGGLLSPHFILIFASCGSVVAGKVLTYVFATVVEYDDGDGSNSALDILVIFSPFLIFPSAGMALSTATKTGMRIFLTHPSVYLMPLFSYFTFSVKVEKTYDGQDERKFISFSLNILWPMPLSTCWGVPF